MKGMSIAMMALAALSTARAGSRTGGLHQLQLLSTEPSVGGTRMNQVILVDDHTCPAGQVEVAAAPEGHNGPRRRRCVPR